MVTARLDSSFFDRKYYSLLQGRSFTLNERYVFRLVSGGTITKLGIRIALNGHSDIECAIFKWNDQEQSCRVAIKTSTGFSLVKDRSSKNRLLRLAIQALKDGEAVLEQNPHEDSEKEDREKLDEWKKLTCSRCNNVLKLHTVRTELVNGKKRQVTTCPTIFPKVKDLDFRNISNSA